MISVVVLTKNEEGQIRRCLDSVKRMADEIIIVDDHSTDHTCEIVANEFKARVINRQLSNDFDAQRNAGIDACTHDWVLQMDADEVIPPDVSLAIQEALKFTDCDAFEIIRRDCVWDIPLKHVGACSQLKLFRKSKGRYLGLIHESLQINGKVGRIGGEVLHYAIPSVEAMIAKHNFYTDLECVKYFKENSNPDISTLKAQLTFKPFKTFFKHYIKRGGYKDGVPGLIWSTIHTLHPMMFWMKVIERHKNNGGR